MDTTKIEPAATEPEEGDYVLEATGAAGTRTTLSQFGIPAYRFFEVYETEAAAGARAYARMETERCWPNVWRLSDHGDWIPYAPPEADDAR